MSTLWTSAEAAAATGGRSTHNWAAGGVSIDSRSLKPGDLFVALTDRRDGHDFVRQALENGAAAALVSRVPDGVPTDAPLLIVDDVLAGLQALGAAARARTAARLIAVTGSVGKTTTKEMLRTALLGQGRVHAAEMSLNNHWGVPLTLARMPANTDYALIEIGMSHAGEITPLSHLARPDVALITTVVPAHMAAFASIDQIATAKAEIFAGLQTGGTAVLNRDIDSFSQLETAALERAAKVVTFGQDQAANFRVLDVLPFSGGVTIKADIHGVASLFKLTTPGRHLAMNAMAALAAVRAVGADTTIAALDLARWQPPQGRGLRHWIALDAMKDEQRLELIDDAYNANPTSMAAAFEVLAAATPTDGLGRMRRGRRIAMVTDMLELGKNEARDHRDLAALDPVQAIDRIHCAGPLMRLFFEALPADKQGEWHDTAENLAARVHALLDAGDVVMVKGSKGSKASMVVDAIRKLGQVAGTNKKGSR